jgi:hypothetical protein
MFPYARYKDAVFLLASRIALAGLVASVILPLGARRARADESRPDEQTAGQVQAALDQLDSDQFAQREQAAAQLDTLVARPQLGSYLAGEFERRLLRADTSFEARTRLERYLKDLPQAPVESAPAGTDEIAPLLDRLSDDRSAERDAAGRRLDVALVRLENVGPVLVQVKSRLANPRLSLQARRALEGVLDKARERWVNAEPPTVTLPPVDKKQMQSWLDDDVLEEPLAPAQRVRRDAARRELVDLLVREDTREQLVALLKEHIEAAEDETAKARYKELSEMAMPAMVAEVWGHQQADPTFGVPDDWEHRQHRTVQHLLIGVPQMVEGAARPTHFDRIDDQTAHCVSGNSLIEGDYPVRVAIPHPNVGFDVMFYLINLPTPREQVQYEYYLRRPEAERLLEISERTLKYFLDNKQVLDPNHISLLMQLDPGAVSRFAGPYFEKVTDRYLESGGGNLAGQETLHTVIAGVLLTVGTHEAVPALEKLARDERTQKPNHDNPFAIAWIAALAIAQRDPWPGADEWLLSLIDEKAPLVLNADTVPELGGTAAGILLARHQVSPFTFDLEPAGNDAFDRSSFAGYRFTSDEGPKALRQWWASQKQGKAAAAAP